MQDCLSTELESQFNAIDRWEGHVRSLVEYDRMTAHKRAVDSLAHSKLELAGWSVAVKDIIDVEGFPTRCNTTFLPDEPATASAAVVSTLQAKGAFVMAKAVTTTFAYFDSGPTRNPWNLDHTPGGSSSGSAVAIACGMVRLALGSQTIGSVIRPASFCGVVGFKPTYGIIPMDGVAVLAPSMDTIGFFTNGVEDMKKSFTALTGESSFTTPATLRIGVIDDLLCESADDLMLNALQETAMCLQNNGHDVQPVTLPQMIAETYTSQQTLFAVEATEAHRQLFDHYGDVYPPRMRRLILQGRQVPKSRLKSIHLQRQQAVDALDRLFDKYDLLLTPAAPGLAPLGIKATGDPRMSMIWTYAGLPTLALPTAVIDGNLPLGVQLVGRRMADHALLDAAGIIEKLINFSDKPQITARCPE